MLGKRNMSAKQDGTFRELEFIDKQPLIKTIFKYSPREFLAGK